MLQRPEQQLPLGAPA
ncbi:hypothetical protein VCHC57A1_2482, partial [Vibrio cholerae HC-57A1]